MFSVCKLGRINYESPDGKEEERPPIAVIFHIATSQPQPYEDDSEAEKSPIDN